MLAMTEQLLRHRGPLAGHERPLSCYLRFGCNTLQHAESASVDGGWWRSEQQGNGVSKVQLRHAAMTDAELTATALALSLGNAM